MGRASESFYLHQSRSPKERSPLLSFLVSLADTRKTPNKQGLFDFRPRIKTSPEWDGVDGCDPAGKSGRRAVFGCPVPGGSPLGFSRSEPRFPLRLPVAILRLFAAPSDAPVPHLAPESRRVALWRAFPVWAWKNHPSCPQTPT